MIDCARTAVAYCVIDYRRLNFLMPTSSFSSGTKGMRAAAKVSGSGETQFSEKSQNASVTNHSTSKRSFFSPGSNVIK